MKIHQGMATVRTGARISIENVTSFVAREMETSGVANGLLVASVSHTTCGLAVNEDESGLKEDIRRVAERLLAPIAEDGRFAHDCVDDNAQAHLTSILLGHSVTVPVRDGRLHLGTWQSVFLIELDGPRSRRLDVQILGM